jgi:peptide/nickel transport system substrate-binding protein
MEKLATPPGSIVPATVPASLQESVPSTGPYEVVTADVDSQVVLERREDFEPWSTAAQPRGFADRIVMEIGGDEEGVHSAVLGGEVDWTDILSEEGMSQLVRRYGSQVHVFPQLVTMALFLNTELPPFDDVDVRRAVNLAVDRQKVLQLFGGPELATITCQTFPLGIRGYEPYCPFTADPSLSGVWSAPDLARAKRLVRGKRRVPVTILGWDDNADVVEHLVEVLKDLGYPATSEIRSLPGHFGKVRTDPEIQAGMTGWFADTPGASSFYQPNFSCATARLADTTNFSRLCDHKIDRLSREAGELQFSDAQKANELWSRIDREVTLTGAWVPLVSTKGADLVSERVGNYSYSPLYGMILSQAWVK